MSNGEIPPAEQSVAKMIDLQHKIAEEHVPAGTGIGIIISPPPDIQIAYNNYILKKERIYIDEYLLSGHMREAKGDIVSKTQEDGHHPHKHDIEDPYEATLILTDTLQVGDLVEVTPLKGEQLFIVKCKLIHLGKFNGFDEDSDDSEDSDEFSFL